MRQLFAVVAFALMVGSAATDDRAARYAWPSLTQDQVIALGESLKGFKAEVVIFCPGADCSALQADLDDAFQIADWQSDFDRRRVDSNDDRGLFVGPRSMQAEILAAEIKRATGIDAQLVDAPDEGKLVVIIGKRPR